ncbi:hypothetical protein COX08_01060 [Candidatus Beckwithbacteria bacterium CG23_combo_of_CG06-09_8_20_14_all_34_8]|uniref:Uncharacterized protein n=1 Tax=Candidatus Beckwithbacteria bacterium CG23_combo_of_CG06-09_8_20_14_all_34_8 TaxID=1974497 RepID=A0A2H0B724_9BACT|nr:MAG: hypothetical protein COX08_01060 [Candidatus Beckwithbacteria bacterium CG23_combo_of_CG06-09_8_20_14_all_34_8]
MARTKKFLASSSRVKNTRSFYRPLKRLKSSTTTTNAVNFHTPKRSISRQQISSNDQYPTVSVPYHNNEVNNKLKLNNDVKTTPKINISNPIISLDDNSPKSENNTQISDQVYDLPEHTEDDNLDFNSHDISEDLNKLEKGMEKSVDKDQEISEEIKTIKEQFDKEKEKMEKTIHVLKKEIEYQQPIRENKFFTISKELQNITQSMNQLLESDSFDTSITPVLQPNVTNSTDQQAIKPTLTEQVKLLAGNSATNPSDNTSKNELPEKDIKQTDKQNTTIPSVESVAITSQNTKPIVADKVSDQNQKPKRKIPKPIAILFTTLIIMGIIGGFAWYTFNKKPEVSTQLIQQYMPSDAKTPAPSALPQEEKKINESNEENSNDSEKTESVPQVKGASDDKYAQSQADIPYSQTIWDTFKDPTVGIEVNYPQNTVNVVKTESSLTFLRKNGYIFKIQIYETAFDIDEYWKSVKANNLNYNVKKTTFRDEPALFLELEDITEFPGDRYIVKLNDYIYDIWYATYSKNLSDDDVKRVDIMLNSFKFLD